MNLDEIDKERERVFGMRQSVPTYVFVCMRGTQFMNQDEIERERLGICISVCVPIYLGVSRWVSETQYINSDEREKEYETERV